MLQFPGESAACSRCVPGTYMLQVRWSLNLKPSPRAASAVHWCHCTAHQQQAWRQRDGSIW